MTTWPRADLVFGRVVAFEPDGWGTVGSAIGDVVFHCTALTDGTRHIDVGTPVVFHLDPGRHGRWEAQRVTDTSGVS